MTGRQPGILSTGLDFVNRLVAPIDRLAVARSDQTPAPIMVVGLPRSGTTLAYEIIVQAFDVAFLTGIYDYTYRLPNLTTRFASRYTRNPPARFESRYGRIPGRFAPAENAVIWKRWIAEHPELGHHCPDSWVTHQHSADARAMTASMTAIAGRTFVFKDVYMSLSLPAFLKLIPGARAVVVQRDPDAVLSSVYAMRKELPATAWRSIRPPFVADIEDQDVLSQCVFQCIRSQHLLSAAIDSLPADQLLTVDYEDLCNNPAGFVAAVTEWSGLPPRDSANIPDHFAPSPGPGLPDDLAQKATELVASLQETGESYLARVETYPTRP